MDRFSEQLTEKRSTGRDNLLKAAIIIGALAVFAGILYIMLLFGSTVVLPCFALAAGDVWLAAYLLQGLFTEYEYIVTNDDLDIDKIKGRRSRKRLITVSLRSVTELGEYTDGTSLSPDVTVMAHDETGQGMWYLLSSSDELGQLAVIFNPDKKTLKNIAGGLSPALRQKYSSLAKSEDGDEEE